MRTSRRSFLRGIGAGAVTAGGLSGVASAQEDASKLRVVNALPDESSIDVFTDAFRRFDDVSFGDIARYEFLIDEEVDITVVSSGDDRDEALLETTVSLDPGTSYTLGVTNSADDPELATFVDENEQPSLKSRFRAVHLSPDAPTLEVDEEDVFSFDDFVARDLDYTAASAYEELLTGHLCFEVEPADEWGDNDLAVYEDEFDSGETYTLFIVGLNDADDEDPPLQVVTSKDT
ncbi:DUF4397 domain-containing protein [Halorientalis litorea]|uniref:DUF4397 domain-containing protein n=1 Tax=Halorientalis litorea TaxID=2931977 RepID=UPI001FF4F366|nr:DUF4397 domain-containing protein [Halorientalis litorea]